MKVFESSSPNVEVIGDSILALVDGMGAFRSGALQILRDNGVADPQGGKWYSQQGFLKAFKEIFEKIGPNTLKVIGRTVPERALLPPTINSIATALSAIDQAFHMNHRGGEIGHYEFKKIGTNSILLRCSNAYPCTFDLGLIMGFANKFKKAGDMPRVAHASGPCRMNDGDYCEYEVKW